MIPILDKSVVIEEDILDMEAGLEKSIAEEDRRIERELIDEYIVENDDNIRGKIADFIKNYGFVHAKGNQEFDNETSDLFAKNGTLVEIVITSGVDKGLLDQMVKC